MIWPWASAERHARACHRLNGNRAVTLQVNATNLLNTVQWTVLDTDINSQTFGNVIAAKPMRAVTMSLRFRF
jgi:hypothetical protein